MGDSYGVQGDSLESIYNSFSDTIASETESSVLTNVYDALNIHSRNNDNYLSSCFDTIDTLTGQLDSFNRSYNEMIENLSNDIDKYNTANSGGSVDTGGSTGGGGGYAGGDYTVDPYTPTEDSLIASSYDGKDYTVDPYVGAMTGTSTPTTSTPTTTSYRDVSTAGGGTSTGGGKLHTGASIGAGAGAISSLTGGLGGPGESVLPQTSYPLGNYKVDSSFINGLPKEVITEKLKQLGFTDDEINAIMGGDYNVSNVLVDELSDKLAEAYKVDSGIRDYLKEQYGFDIFNEDGTVNNDRLSLALYMDDKSGLDDYSLISTLGNKYGINVVDPTAMLNYTKEFESMFMKDSNIRKLFMEKYGFDVFNPDGTINKDRLALAMLIDQKSNGKYSLDAFLREAKSSSLVNTLGNNVTKITSGKQEGGSKLPYLAGAAVVGAGAVGAGIMMNKRKEQQDNQEHDGENRFITELNYEEKQDEDNEYWVNKIINDEGVENNG